MYELIATELNSLNLIDGEVLSNFLKQTCRKISIISDNGAYDITQCDEIERIKRAALLISLREEQFFKNEIIRVISWSVTKSYTVQISIGKGDIVTINIPY